MKKLFIDDFRIGGDKTFIVAELSANHNQNLDIAVQTIIAAKKAGADAIKLQTYTPDTITINCNNEYFQIKQGTLWDGQTLYDLYKSAYTPWEWHETLFKTARDIGLICFSSPFDYTAVDFLEQFNPPAYKIASFEITDIPLIEYIASKNRPVIISTGIANKNDIEEAIGACRKMKNDQIILLKCTSSYPAPYEEINLKSIPYLNDYFGYYSGLSDHTLGIEVPVAAVVLGAVVIEKHFILDKNIGGPDAAFSLTPGELTSMINAIRNIEKSIGKESFEPSASSLKNRFFSRSLFVIKDINSGELFTSENIRSIRPGNGLPPKYLYKIIGKKAKKNLKKGTPLQWDFIEK